MCKKHIYLLVPVNTNTHFLDKITTMNMDEIEYVLACFILWNFVCWYLTLWACQIFNQNAHIAKIGWEPLFHTNYGHWPTSCGEAHPHEWIWLETNLFWFDLDFKTYTANNMKNKLSKCSSRMFISLKLAENRFFITTMAMDPLFVGKHTHMSGFGQKRTCYGLN